jgi:subtilisin family serine protease
MSDIGDLLAFADASVPGEVVFSLTADGERATGWPDAAAGAVRETLPGPTGAEAVDDLLSRWGTRTVTRLDVSPSLPTSAERAAADRREAGPRHVLRARFDPEQLSPNEAAEQLLQRSDVVRAASPNHWRAALALPNDPELSRQWGLNAIRAPQAWDLERGQPSVLVAVLDTGCDVAHRDLVHAFAPGSSIDLVDVDPRMPPAPDWRWEGDVTQRDDVAADEVGHGTHIAGIIAAATHNGFLGAGIAGCRLLNVRVLGRLVHRSGTVIGFGTSFDITAGIEWATRQRASIINMSFGFRTGSRDEKEAIERAFAANVLPVAAMGNDRSRNDPMAPAIYPDVVAVGALEPSGLLWPESQTGLHIDLVAPGVDVASTLAGGGFGSQTGTSMATAFVSGVAALVRSRVPTLPATDLRDLLRTTANPLGMPVRPNESAGWGCVDAFAALRALGIS